MARPGSTGVIVDAVALERVGVALADSTRRRLLLTLLDGPAYPADLADPRLAHALADLAGLVLLVEQHQDASGAKH